MSLLGEIVSEHDCLHQGSRSGLVHTVHDYLMHGGDIWCFLIGFNSAHWATFIGPWWHVQIIRRLKSSASWIRLRCCTVVSYFSLYVIIDCLALAAPEDCIDRAVLCTRYKRVSKKTSSLRHGEPRLILILDASATSIIRPKVRVSCMPLLSFIHVYNRTTV